MNKYAGLLLVLFSIIMISCGGADDSPKKSAKNLPPPKKETPKKTTSSSQATKKTTTASAGATPEELAKAKEIIADVSNKEVAAVDAKRKYKMFCTTCHGTKGDLNVNGAKDLTVSSTSLEESVAQIYHGKGLMTPFKGILNDAEIVAVSKYIVKLRR